MRPGDATSCQPRVRATQDGGRRPARASSSRADDATSRIPLSLAFHGVPATLPSGAPRYSFLELGGATDVTVAFARLRAGDLPLSASRIRARGRRPRGGIDHRPPHLPLEAHPQAPLGRAAARRRPSLLGVWPCSGRKEDEHFRRLARPLAVARNEGDFWALCRALRRPNALEERRSCSFLLSAASACRADAATRVCVFWLRRVVGSCGGIDLWLDKTSLRPRATVWDPGFSRERQIGVHRASGKGGKESLRL